MLLSCSELELVHVPMYENHLILLFTTSPAPCGTNPAPTVIEVVVCGKRVDDVCEVMAGIGISICIVLYWWNGLPI